MLVLTRKQNEKIQIGDNITITVLRMKGKAVRLGIQAPAEYGVIRGELIFDIEQEAEQPSAPASDDERSHVQPQHMIKAVGKASGQVPHWPASSPVNAPAAVKPEDAGATRAWSR